MKQAVGDHARVNLYRVPVSSQVPHHLRHIGNGALGIGSSIMRLVGIRGSLGNTECMCYTHGSMNPQPKNVCDGQMSLFPGRSARILRFRGTHESNTSLKVCPGC